MHETLAAIARERGTPCFVYDMDEAYARIESLRGAFGGRFLISYAVKSNPNPAVLRRLRDRADLLDVSSAGELGLAIAAGWPPRLLSFTGPAKLDGELAAAVEAGIGEVVVESVAEAERLDACARAAGRRQRVLIRVNPIRVPRGFGVNMAGKPSQFGVDEEALDDAIARVAGLDHLDLRGFHIYSGTQCLAPESVAENYEIFIDIFRRAARAHGAPPELLIFGAGLGIPYHETDTPLDLAPIAQRTNPALDALLTEPLFSGARCVLETGRYIIGEAGLYLTRVVGEKISRGAEIRICDGGLNHHLAACGHFGSVFHRNYRMFKLGGDNAPGRKYNLVGPLCTTIDTLGRDVELPPLGVGDVVAIRSSGAYGASASPMHFISRDPPREYLVETVDGVTVVEDATQFAPRPDAAPPRRDGRVLAEAEQS